jgi:hypothetical protein
MRPLRVLVLSVFAMLVPSWSGGQPMDRNDPNIRNIQTITVKWKRTTGAAQAQSPTAEQVQDVRQAAGVELGKATDHGWGTVFQLPRYMSRHEAEEIAARIRTLPEVEHAIADVPLYLDAVPNDPLYQPRQWNLQSGLGGIHAESVWDLLGAGDVATVVAVIDSGLLFGHEDLVGRVVSLATTGTPRARASRTVMASPSANVDRTTTSPRLSSARHRS